MNTYFGALLYTRQANGALRGIVAENDFLGPDWGGQLGTELASPREVAQGDIAGLYCSSTYIPNGTDVFTGPLRIQRIGMLYSLHWTKPGAVPFFGVGFQIPNDPDRYCFAFYGHVVPPYWTPPAAQSHEANTVGPRSTGSIGNLDTILGVTLLSEQPGGAWTGPLASSAHLEGASAGRLGQDRWERIAAGDGVSGTFRAVRSTPDASPEYDGLLQVNRTGQMHGLHWSGRGEAPLLGVSFEDPTTPGRHIVATWGLRPSAFWNPPPDFDCSGHGR